MNIEPTLLSNNLASAMGDARMERMITMQKRGAIVDSVESCDVCGEL